MARPAPAVLVWCSAGDPSGGMERIAISIAGGLAARGWRVILAGPFRDSATLLASVPPDVTVVHHRPEKTTLGLFRTMQFLRRVAREHRVNLISAHGSVFPLIFTRTPTVWTEHGLRYGGSMLAGIRGLVWRWIRFRIRRRAWRVIAVSRHVQTSLCDHLRIPGHPIVIYNGLPNADALRKLPPARMQPPYQIGFLGRLTAIKRPLEIFELSAILNRMGVSHEWNIFGDGELMPQVQAMAAQPTGHSVRICGVANNPQDAFARIDLLAFLSRGEIEGLGMVLVEAMAANRRIVAWDAGCIGEVLNGHRALVPRPFFLEKFAQAIADELRKAPPRYEDNRWEEARMIDEYERVFSETIRW